MTRSLNISSLFLSMLFFAVACSAGPNNISHSEADMEVIAAAANDAISEGDYKKAIDLSQPFAKDGDPEAIFTVGMLMLEWIEDPSAKEKPNFSHEEALSYIREAASLDVVQAASLLRSGYEFGRYSLPHDTVNAQCWRSVERGEVKANSCN